MYRAVANTEQKAGRTQLSIQIAMPRQSQWVNFGLSAATIWSPIVPVHEMIRVFVPQEDCLIYLDFQSCLSAGDSIRLQFHKSSC